MWETNDRYINIQGLASKDADGYIVSSVCPEIGCPFSNVIVKIYEK